MESLKLKIEKFLAKIQLLKLQAQAQRVNILFMPHLTKSLMI